MIKLEKLKKPEIVWVLLKVGSELFVIQKAVRVSNTKEEPRQTTKFVSWDIFHEHTTQVATVRSNTGASGNHDMSCIWIILWKKHNFARGACMKKNYYEMLRTGITSICLE